MTALTGPINFPYTAIDLTEGVDVMPNMYGRVNDLGLFPHRGITSTLVEIDFRDGNLTILAHTERGAPPTVDKAPTENAIIMKVPHIPHMATIKPEDMQDRFAFNSGKRPKGLEDAVQEKLLNIRNKHSITLEFLRMGALKGLIVDGAGATLYDLFTVFNVAQLSVDFLLGTAGTNVMDKCREVVRNAEDNLKGEVMSGVHALVSPEFFDKLVGHANVEKFYLQQQDAASLRGNDIRKGFVFGGIVFEEYRAVASDIAGASQKFITAQEGHAFPVGTMMNTHETLNAPPDHIEWVNAMGPEIFVSPDVLPHGQGVELRSQSNPLTVWKRPILLQKVHTSN